MDYFIIAIATAAGLYFHGWLYIRIRRWTDRDLALSLAGDNELHKKFMLERLTAAREQKIKRRDLQQWLEAAAAGYPDQGLDKDLPGRDQANALATPPDRTANGSRH
ncbi:Ribosomal protein S3 [Pseudomonas batumici]|uniref:Ribosomal protein S3 n=1 Tax=Pseudomonas batumici TaxID=226910 RepID=A0A0C2IJG1_9PSED|nr:Ribosomal protein S3 [Pseudomonas batumici]